MRLSTHSLAGGRSLASARCAPLQARARFKASSRPTPQPGGPFLGKSPSDSRQLLITSVAKRSQGSQSTALQQQEEEEGSQAVAGSSGSGDQFGAQESAAPNAWGLPLPQLATKTQLVMACSLGFCLANMGE